MTEYKKSLIYTILFLFFITTFAIYDIRSGYLKELSNVRSRVANTSFLIQAWVKGSFDSSDYVLQDIMSQVSIQELLDLSKKEKTTQFLQSKLETLPSYFQEIGISNESCVATSAYVVAPYKNFAGVDYSEREWCKSYQRNDKLIKDVTSSFFDIDRLIVAQNRSIRTSDGKLQGIVALVVDLSFFQKWLDEIVVTKHGVIAIVDANMNLLARKPQLPNAIGNKIDDKILKEFLSSSENFKISRDISPLDDESRLYAARKISGLPFVIIVGEADKDWLKEWKEKTFATVVVIVIFLVLSILILRNHWKQLKLRQKLDYHANTDVLTGISNRRNFMHQANQELKRVKRHQTQMALLLLDIDRFKLINDNYGHATGDRALVAFAGACKKSIRDIDILGRLGGDEFTILLLNTEIEEARIVTERIRLSIELCEFLNDKEESVSMTSSIGVAMIDSKTSSLEDMLDMADSALYVSKEKGRNNVEFAELK